MTADRIDGYRKEPARIRRNRIKAQLLDVLADQHTHWSNLDELADNYGDFEQFEDDFNLVCSQLAKQLHAWAVRIQPPPRGQSDV